MYICPYWKSYNRNKIFKIDVLPDPVLPTKATFSPFLINREKFFKAYLTFWLYKTSS